MKRFIRIFLFLLVSVLFSNINVSNARTDDWPPIYLFSKTTTDGYEAKSIITGLATYYANQFEGGVTATGEIFHHCNLTAASNFFALNTWVKVTNLLTGKSIIVRINDRMHPDMSEQGRILDLTLTGAKQLKIVNRGVAKVKVEPVSQSNEEAASSSN